MGRLGAGGGSPISHWDAGCGAHVSALPLCHPGSSTRRRIYGRNASIREGGFGGQGHVVPTDSLRRLLKRGASAGERSHLVVQSDGLHDAPATADQACRTHRHSASRRRRRSGVRGCASRKTQVVQDLLDAHDHRINCVQ